MPPAVDIATPARPRSLSLARAVLLGAAVLGLGGLSLPGGTAPTQPVALAAASAVVPVSDAALHAPVFRSPPRRVAPPRAARKRPAAVKRAAPRPAAKKVASYYRPSRASVNSTYGMRWGRMHKGIDFAASSGSDIRAVAEGVVIGAGYLSGESGYGLITLIRHPSGTVTAYAHQSKLLVHSGERVDAGEVIGLVGSTGHSTGPHLHFEVRTSGGHVNPITWLRERGVSI